MRRRIPLSAAFLLFSYALIAFLVIAAIIAANARAAPAAFPGELTVWQGFTLVAAGIFFAGLVIRKVMLRAFWELLFAAALFLGVWVYAWFLLPFEVALLAAASLTILQARIRRVAFHDAFVLIGGAGVALNFAFLFSDIILIPFFAAMMIYDMFSARPGGVTAELASRLIHRGVIPGLIVPGSWSARWSDLTSAVKHPESVFLGAGDLVLPMVLTARAAVFSIPWGIGVAAGAALGAFWLGKRGPSKPYPALVPIGIGALIPYLLMILMERM